MDIGSRLRNLLDEQGMTQKYLAEELNISATTLNGYIQNRRQPDAGTMIRLASYFHTTTDYIYGISSVREPFVSSYNTDEQYLIDVYRGMPEDKQTLYIEAAHMLSQFEKKKKN